jgi:uncharacterized protein (DUF433 family)
MVAVKTERNGAQRGTIRYKNHSLESRAKSLYTVSVNYAHRITFDPEQCGGRPCVRHYRIRVKDVLDLMAAGVSEAEILKDYNFLEPEDIRACLEFAAEQVSYPVLVNV